MKAATRLLLITLVMLAALCGCVHAGTVTGAVQTSSSGAVPNATFTFALSQPAIVSGTATVVGTPVPCYTDSNGNVVGEPNPLVVPLVTPSIAAGTLAAGTYFVQITYYDASGESFPSPEISAVLAAPGQLNITVPALQPQNATGYKVYIGTASGNETLQSTISGFFNYTQSTALAAGAALPVSNSTACKLRFNDELIPSYTWYLVTLNNASGSMISGYPQRWRFMGGSSGTVNLSLGTPVAGSVNAVYPQAVIMQPALNGLQSINGPITVLGTLTAGAGRIDITPIQTATAPPPNTARLYVDPTTLNLKCLLNGGASCLPAPSMQVSNVKTFGAKGDGVTNDKTAIDAAISNGCPVYFPAGTYMYDTGLSGSGTSITLPTNCLMFGDGIGRSIVKRKLSVGANYTGLPLIHNIGWKSVGDQNITIRDITIDNGQGSVGTVTADYGAGTIMMQGVTGLRIHDVAFQNCDPGTHTFTGGTCIGGWAWNDVWIENSTFSNWCPGNCAAIYPQFNAANGSFASTLSRGIHILHNNIDGSVSGSSGIKIFSFNGGTAGKVQELEITGNKVIPDDGRRTYSGVSVTAGSATISGIPGGNFTSDMAGGTNSVYVLAAGSLQHITHNGTPYGPFTIAGIQLTAGAGTLTTTTSMYASIGDWIQVSGTTNYNSFFKITGVSSGTAFTFAGSGTFAPELAGTVKNAPIFPSAITTVNSATSITLTNTIATTNANTTLIWSDAALAIELFTGGDPTVIKDFVIANNEITAARPIGAANPNVTTWCISVGAASNGTISGNHCEEVHTFGIELVDAINVAVSANTLFHSGKSTLDVNDGNSVMQPMTGVTWTSNIFNAPVLDPQSVENAVIMLFNPGLNANTVIKDAKFTANVIQMPVGFDVLGGGIGNTQNGGGIFANCSQFGGANACLNTTIIGNTFAGVTTVSLPSINQACCGGGVTVTNSSNTEVVTNKFHDFPNDATAFVQDANSGKTHTRFLLNDTVNVASFYSDACTVGCHTLAFNENKANDDLMFYLRPDGTGLNMDFCTFAAGTCPGNYDIFSFTMSGGQPVLSMVDQAGHTFLQFDSSVTPPVLNMNFTGSTCGIAGCVAFRKATTTFGTLPACDAAHANEEFNITDSNTAVWGANAAAGGANNVGVRCNGANWTVVGK